MSAVLRWPRCCFDAVAMMWSGACNCDGDVIDDCGVCGGQAFQKELAIVKETSLTNAVFAAGTAALASRVVQMMPAASSAVSTTVLKKDECGVRWWHSRSLRGSRTCLRFCMRWWNENVALWGWQRCASCTDATACNFDERGHRRSCESMSCCG